MWNMLISSMKINISQFEHSATQNPRFKKTYVTLFQFTMYNCRMLSVYLIINRNHCLFQLFRRMKKMAILMNWIEEKSTIDVTN